MRIICWIIEFFQTIYYGVPISGHKFKGDNPHGTLTCSRCGYKSKNESIKITRR